MKSRSRDRAIVQELYRALVLLGSDSDLLGTVGSWGDSLPETEVLAGLRAWNEHSLRELRERIGHYEISSPDMGCNRDEARQISEARP
jgi:hypothetical protein